MSRKLPSPPNLIETLVGAEGNATNESNRLVGTELAVQSLSRTRDNPRKVLSIGPSLVAFPPCHWATVCILGGEKEEDPRARGAMHGSARYEPVCHLHPVQSFLFGFLET